MDVDVSTEIVIERPAATVALFAANPDNAPKWYVNITSVDWKTDPPLGVGSRLAFVARFLRRKLVYTYEVAEFVPNVKLVMRTIESSFPMETTYTWEQLSPSVTLMTLRNRGTPRGPQLMAPLMARAMRRANEKDLARLKQLVET